MKKKDAINIFTGMLIGILATMAVWTSPSIESLLNGLGAVIVLMFAIWYNQQ